MQAILLLPFRFVHYLIRVQEIKRYSFYVLLAFCVFTGTVRGLEEIVLFGLPLKNSEVITFIHFYLSLAVILTAGIATLGRLPWQKVSCVILVGIFLGIFPPILDFALSPRSQVFYGFYFIHDWRGIPWFGLKPEFNFPLGECITIWLSIFFSAYYVFYKTRSFWRSALTGLYAYGGFMLFGSLLPMLVTYLVAGNVPTLEHARSLDDSLLRSIVYYNAFAQIALASIVYLLLRLPLLKHLLRRSLHPLPFLLATLCGAASSGKLDGHAWLATAIVFWGSWMNLLQNRLYDLEDDRAQNREQISQQDVLFFNTAFLLGLAAIFFTANRMVLPIALMYALAFLYNHPDYRGKKKFPTNLKIEGMWGVGAFAAGALSVQQSLPDSLPLVCLLVWGGFSFIAALKDAKDVRSDKRAGTQTLYLKLMALGLSFRRAHAIIFALCMLAFLVPPVIFFVRGVLWPALGLTTWTALWWIVLALQFPDRRWFGQFLFFAFAYLSGCLVIILQSPELVR